MGDIVFLVGAGVVGYLVGSISSTRILARRLIPSQELSRTEWPLDDAGVIVTHGVSPLVLGARAGHRWGGLAALLDIVKAFLVTLIFALISPSAAAPAAAATAGASVVLGHAYPIFHRFQGGWGQSPIMGAVLVLDWLALPVTVAGGWLVGLLIGDTLIAMGSWPLLLIPFALWRGDSVLLGWAVLVNVVYWVRMMPILRQHMRIQRGSPRPWRTRVAGVLRGPRTE